MSFDNCWAESGDMFARYSSESHKVAGQHPGSKSIESLGTARGHGICRLALGAAAECFAVGRVFHTCVMSTGDRLVSWTFVLLSKDCSNMRWEGNGDKLQLRSSRGEGEGCVWKISRQETKQKTKYGGGSTRRVRAIGQIARLVGNYSTSWACTRLVGKLPD